MASSRGFGRALAACACAPALIGAFALAGCGGSSGGETVRPLGEPRAGTAARLAQCRDWNEGSVPEKLATITNLRKQGPDGDPRLADAEAMAIVDRACEEGYAAGVRLYKIYYRALAFSAIEDEIEGDGE